MKERKDRGARETDVKEREESERDRGAMETKKLKRQRIE